MIVRKIPLDVLFLFSEKGGPITNLEPDETDRGCIYIIYWIKTTSPFLSMGNYISSRSVSRTEDVTSNLRSEK